MRRLVISFFLAVFVIMHAGKTAYAKDISIHLEFGATKVSGNLFKDRTYGMISGLGLFYTATSYLQFGFQGRYTKWTPDQVEPLPGSNRIVEGSIKNIELMGLLRIRESANRLTYFGEIGLGYCFLDSSAEVFSRPVVPDPGPYTYLYTIDSQNKPSVRVGIGMMYQITERIGMETNGKYNYIFTDDESTKYYSVNGSLVMFIF